VQKQGMMGYKDGNVCNLVHRHTPFVVEEKEHPLDKVQCKLHNQNTDLQQLQTDVFEVGP
jgi:hypothetical protein